MKDRHLPYMPFYGDDFYSSTSHLTAAERDCYLAWMWQAWKRGGRLPNKERWLRQWAKVDNRAWKRVRDAVLAEWWELSDDKTHYTQRRLSEEVSKAEDRSATNAMNGRKGGRPRKHPELPLEGGKDALSVGALRDTTLRATTLEGEKPNKINGPQNQTVLTPEGAKNPEKSLLRTQNSDYSPPPLRGAPPDGEATPRSEGISNLVLGTERRRFPALVALTPLQEHYDLATTAGKDPAFVDRAAERLVLWSKSHARARVTDWNAEFKKRLIEDLDKAPTRVRTRPRSGLGAVLDKLERGYNDQHNVDPESGLPPITDKPALAAPARPSPKRAHGRS